MICSFFEIKSNRLPLEARSAAQMAEAGRALIWQTGSLERPLMFACWPQAPAAPGMPP